MNIIQKYSQKLILKVIVYPNSNLYEHYDMHAKVSYIGYMEDPHITTDDVTQQIREIKEWKSAGPDGIKSDLFKILGNDIQCINILTESMNKIITKQDNIPES